MNRRTAVTYGLVVVVVLLLVIALPGLNDWLAQQQAIAQHYGVSDLVPPPWPWLQHLH